MIEARDLRIGNYILDDEGRFVKVERIESPEFSEWNCSGDEPIIFSINGRMMMSEVIKPIPLTEEILLKCGFVKGNIDRYNFLYLDFNVIRFLYDKNSVCAGIMGTYNFNYFNNNCQYLHQLQNLYFALTGEELEIQL